RPKRDQRERGEYKDRRRERGDYKDRKRERGDYKDRKREKGDYKEKSFKTRTNDESGKKRKPRFEKRSDMDKD
ncbi:MAG: hypothetical protein ACXAC7_06285, partial [Candidatus Hodarchaeales archaeon]